MKRVFRTQQKISGVRTVFRKWSEWAVGDVLIGKFMGTQIDKYKKVCPIIEILDAQFKDGKGDALHGKTIMLNHNGMVGKAMEKVDEGQLVQFTYNGYDMIEKGLHAGKEAHNVSVDIVTEGEDILSDEEEDYFSDEDEL